MKAHYVSPEFWHPEIPWIKPYVKKMDAGQGTHHHALVVGHKWWSVTRMFHYCMWVVSDRLTKFQDWSRLLFHHWPFMTAVLICSSCQDNVVVVTKLHHQCLFLGVRTGDGSCYSSIHPRGQNDQKQSQLSRFGVFTTFILDFLFCSTAIILNVSLLQCENSSSVKMFIIVV